MSACLRCSCSVSASFLQQLCKSARRSQACVGHVTSARPIHANAVYADMHVIFATFGYALDISRDFVVAQLVPRNRQSRSWGMRSQAVTSQCVCSIWRGSGAISQPSHLHRGGNQLAKASSSNAEGSSRVVRPLIMPWREVLAFQANCAVELVNGHMLNTRLRADCDCVLVPCSGRLSLVTVMLSNICVSSPAVDRVSGAVPPRYLLVESDHPRVNCATEGEELTSCTLKLSRQAVSVDLFSA